MIPQPITLNGRTGTIVYMDALWKPVTPELASMAKIVFDDGSVAFYFTESDARKREYVRDEKGRFSETGAAQAIIEKMRAKFSQASSYNDTMFILPDGTRLSHYDTHGDAAYKIGEDLYDILRAGVVRYKSGAGAEVAAPITEAQAQHIFDSYAFTGGNQPLLVDVSNGHLREAKSFYPDRDTADSIRYWVSDFFKRTQKLQSIAKFDEAEHPREPSGSDKGGQFAETGRAGEPTPHPALARDAKVGIAAVEKLIPEAVTSASYKTNKAVTTWYDLDDDTQDKVRQSWMEEQYDNGVDVDATQLQEEFRSEIQKDNQEALDAAVENLSERFKSTRLQAKFKDPDPTLPLPLQPGESEFKVTPFDLHKVVDLDTLDYGEGEHEEAGWLPSGRRNHGGTVKLDLEALRFTSGEALTKAEQLVVQEEWDQAYSYEYQRLVENALSSSEYDRRYSELEGELVQQGWSNLSDADKFEFMQRRNFASVLTLKPGEPKQWVTGVEEGEHGDDNYNRTHAVALRLTELRTDQLREERGLLKPTEKPTFTVEPAKDHNSKRPNFVAHDAYGRVIAASNTLEQATLNAEEWAKSVSERQGKVETKKLIADVWGAWKSSSSEGLSMSMQLAAAQEFDGLHRMTPEEVQKAEIDAIPYGGIETLKAYVRAQWEVTQTVMAKANEDRIDVYRGLMLEGSKVNKTPNVVLSPEGKPLEAPTNVQVTKDTSFGGIPVKNTKPWAIRETVTFDYGGEHLTTLKERVATPGTWAEVTADVQKQMRDEWAKNAKQVTDELGKGYSYEAALGTFEKFSDTTKMKLLIDWRQIGTIPPEPFESTEAAVARRVQSYHADREHPVIVKLPEMKILRAGAQSTTGTPTVANEWGGVGKVPDDAVRVVIRISAPPTSVLALPVYGQNMFEEHESVLLGTRDKWLWDAWRDRAPEFKTYPLGTTMAKKAETEPLVIDLQAEDRGKPHWMQGVNWQSVAKKYVNVLKWSEAQHPRDQEGQFTRVAMTSQRTEGDPGHQSNREVFTHMREFHDRLKALPGVTNVSVKPGVGGWEGGSESMWQIYYKGNGEAKKLVAQTAKTYNQDAVLVLNKCGGGADCQPAVELSFQGAVSPQVRDHIHKILVANGIGGWTWMKREGKTLLRMVSVPQWGGEAEKHQKATAEVSRQLREDGLPNHRHVHKVAVSVMEREGTHSYDSIIGR